MTGKGNFAFYSNSIKGENKKAVPLLDVLMGRLSRSFTRLFFFSLSSAFHMNLQTCACIPFQNSIRGNKWGVQIEERKGEKKKRMNLLPYLQFPIGELAKGINLYVHIGDGHKLAYSTEDCPLLGDRFYEIYIWTLLPPL
ncbi:hypothetical protein POVWA2_024250 [Plasmodium ovale wallikeri]|uniref:Uncharacterized protein n=1 Tax=Plasmodium ovale wallikeri TaxID=864142 RepID=A0A1A8YUC9_PLAOA|nr:hypothetical protein POVWA1_024370 [Plasmodium ovale wallikeri]SBT35273.1 hypothetical protein POVWA2_024250 [Plasmodium ovale wallikeri]